MDKPQQEKGIFWFIWGAVFGITLTVIVFSLLLANLLPRIQQVNSAQSTSLSETSQITVEKMNPVELPNLYDVESNIMLDWNQEALIFFALEGCPYCQRLTSLLSEKDTFNLNKLIVIGYSTSDSIGNFQKELNPLYELGAKVFIDETGSYVEENRITEFPQLFVVKKGGDVTWHLSGLPSNISTSQDLKALLDDHFIDAQQ